MRVIRFLEFRYKGIKWRLEDEKVKDFCTKLAGAMHGKINSKPVKVTICRQSKKSHVGPKLVARCFGELCKDKDHNTEWMISTDGFNKDLTFSELA